VGQEALRKAEEVRQAALAVKTAAKGEGMDDLIDEIEKVSTALEQSLEQSRRAEERVKQRDERVAELAKDNARMGAELRELQTEKQQLVQRYKHQGEMLKELSSLPARLEAQLLAANEKANKVRRWWSSARGKLTLLYVCEGGGVGSHCHGAVRRQQAAREQVRERNGHGHGSRG